MALLISLKFSPQALDLWLPEREKVVAMSEGEAGDFVPAAKKLKRAGFGLGDLPDLALLEIAKHLDVKDLVSFSHTNSRVWHLVGDKSELWLKLLQSLNFLASPRLNSLATHLSALFPVGCDNKRKLMLYNKTLNNWKAGNIAHSSMQWARYFAARNDILLFACIGDLLDGNGHQYKAFWNFTALGPKVALNWVSLRPHPEAYLLPIANPDVFIFENTICLKTSDIIYDGR